MLLAGAACVAASTSRERLRLLPRSPQPPPAAPAETLPLPPPGRWVCEAGPCTEPGPAELALVHSGERQRSVGFISVEPTQDSGVPELSSTLRVPHSAVTGGRFSQEQFQPTVSSSSGLSVLPLVAAFRRKQLRSQLSLLVIARMLGQQEAPLLWKEEAQPLLGSHCGDSLDRTCHLRLQAYGRIASRWLPGLPSAGGAPCQEDVLWQGRLPNCACRDLALHVGTARGAGERACRGDVRWLDPGGKVLQAERMLVVLGRLLSLMRPAALGQLLDSEASPPRRKQQPMASAERDYKGIRALHVRSVAAEPLQSGLLSIRSHTAGPGPALQGLKGQSLAAADASQETGWKPSLARRAWKEDWGEGLRAARLLRPLQVCYLCHSLLTLAGVVVSCQDLTPDQWHPMGPSQERLTCAPSTCPVPLLSFLPDFSGRPSTVPLQEELRLLCMQLDRHISTHIRESPQAMHRTKLKDLATQTYIRWQELLTHCRPQVVPLSPPDLGGEGSGQAADQSQSTAPPPCPPPRQLLSFGLEKAGEGRVGEGRAWTPSAFLSRVRYQCGISNATQLFSGGKELGNVATASAGEGAFMCTSKDPVVTESKLGCLPSYLLYSSGLCSSDAKF
ncbi:hypothetical protein QTO34_006313 [Cnephaeus nilssonii]|uniref:Protein FAM178B n=1 Tax=Cnephaeus nilssonii TaxID=3371016 RepID=A0AA40HK98_CNENI|nr:hypothetical protein QTO34_006313 [Eptesicus nilssonii]